MISGVFNDSGSGGGRNAAVVFAAVAISIAVHFSLFVSLEDKSFGIFNPVVKAVRNAVARKPPVKIDIPELNTPKILDDPLASADAGGDGGMTSAETLDRLSSVTPANLFDPPPVPEIETGSVMDSLAPPPAPELEPYQPRNEILQITDAATRDLRAPIPRREIPAVERQRIAPDITSSYNLLAGLGKAESQGGNILDGLYTPAPVLFEPAKGIGNGAETKELPVPELGPESEPAAAVQVVAEIPSEVAPARPLDDKLRITTHLYRGGAADPYIYFAVDVFRKDAD